MDRASVEFLVSPRLYGIQHIFLYVLLFNLLLLGAFFPFWKNNKRAWYFLFELILCLIPVSGSKISSRVLGFACIPAFAFMAEVLVSFYLQRKSFFSDKVLNKIWNLSLSLLAIISLFTHLIIAPLILVQSQSMLVSQFDRLLNIPAKKLQLPKDIHSKKLILVNPPNAALISYLPLIQRLDGKPNAENTWILSSGYAGIKVSRIDDNTLEIEPKGGFLADASEKIFRSAKFPMQTGEKLELNGMLVTILSLNQDQRPQSVAFRFEQELESDVYVFKSWTKIDGIAQFGEFELPAVGESIELAPALPF